MFREINVIFQILLAPTLLYDAIPHIFTRFLPVNCAVGNITQTFLSISENSRNLNILRKLALNILRLVDVGKKNVGIAKKRNMIGWNLPKYLEQILTI